MIPASRPDEFTVLILDLEGQGRYTEALALDAITDWQELPPLDGMLVNFNAALELVVDGLLAAFVPFAEQLTRICRELELTGDLDDDN